MAIQLDLNPQQLGAIVELIMGLVNIDDDFDFLEASEIGDIFALLIDGPLPLDSAQKMANFDFDKFDMEATCEALIEHEVESNEIINLLLQVAQVDEYFDAKEHEYISEVADLIGADLEDLEIELIEGIELSPPKIPTA